MKLMIIPVSRILLFFLLVLFSTAIFAQYPPPAGKPGTSAMHRDSSAFISWASSCKIDRGFVNISDTAFTYNGSTRTTYGSYLYATGPADELVVSLGDHGTATLGFDVAIKNRPGPDFAVFENSFGDSFLELAFIEVSSDGQHFVRIPAVSLTQFTRQVNTFDTIDATKINNFAGKYRQGYGTPFDLEDIRDSAGIDLAKITTVRIVDAIGCIQDAFAETDSQGHKVNDPWPTPFDTGGFDLDAVGVIHNQVDGLGFNSREAEISVYPNPVVDKATISSRVFTVIRMKLSDPTGNVLIETSLAGKSVLDLSSFNAGIYIATFTFQDESTISKKIIKY